LGIWGFGDLGIWGFGYLGYNKTIKTIYIRDGQFAMVSVQ